MTPRAPRSTKRIAAPTTIDSYLATVSPEERISYQLPAFKLDGRLLVAFGAAAKRTDSASAFARRSELPDR